MPNISPINIAAGKPSSQSSTAHGGVPSRAVDGIPTVKWEENSCTVTNQQSNPWWMVDLKRNYNIGKIVVTNRDTAAERLDGFEIRVGSSNYDGGSPNPV